MGSELMRIGDADRERYIGHLSEMYGQGRLSHEELDARVNQVLASWTQPELDKAVPDLPRMKTPEMKRERDWVHIAGVLGIPGSMVTFSGMMAMTIFNQMHPAGVYDTPGNVLCVALGIAGMLLSIAVFFTSIGTVA